MKKDIDWYEDNMKILSDAMLEANQRFNEYINDELNLDGAYFEIEMCGYVLDNEFDKWKRIDMKFERDKDGDE